MEGDWIPMNSIGDVLHDCRQTEGTQHADTLPSAGRRQRQGTRHILSLPSAARPAHGKGRARAQNTRQPSGRLTAVSLRRVPTAGTRQRPNFAECLSWHSAKTTLRRVPSGGTRQIFFLAFNFFYSLLKFENLIPDTFIDWFTIFC